MKGPTPIMSIMFSAVALVRPMPRINSGDEGLFSGASGEAIQFLGWETRLRKRRTAPSCRILSCL